MFTHATFVDFLEKVFKETIDIDLAINWLEEAYNSLQSESAQLSELIEKSGYFDVSPEEVEYGLTAMGDYQAAIEAVHSFLSEGWEEGLEVAIERAGEAHQKMLVAHDLAQQTSLDLAFEAVY
ncbi:MAG: hypothetical protein AB7S38_15460 [Vulcanimicrobiota bacterium]